MFGWKQKYTEAETMAYFYWIMKTFLCSNPTPKQQREVGHKLSKMIRGTWNLNAGAGAPYHVAWISAELRSAK